MTRSELEWAIQWALGDKVYAALKQADMALPELLKQAALRTFHKDLRTAGLAEKLRAGLDMLEKQGYFSFDPE